MPLIQSQIGSGDEDPWISIGTALITGDGVPRPTFAQLRDKDAKVPDWAFLARAALRAVADSARADARIIKKLLAAAPINAWGSAVSLIEFGDHPVLILRLRQALRDDIEGTSYIAWTLARNGHKAFLDDALARASGL